MDTIKEFFRRREYDDDVEENNIFDSDRDYDNL